MKGPSVGMTVFVVLATLAMIAYEVFREILIWKALWRILY